MKDETFEKHRLGLLYELLHAHQCLENYNQLDCALHKYSGIKYYHFLSYTERAFYNCFINSIHNLISYEKSTNNIAKMLNHIGSSPNLSQLYDKVFRQNIGDIISENGRFKDIIYRINFERDKYISHNEEPSINFIPKVKYEEGRNYLDELVKAFNDICGKYDKSTYHFDLPFLQADSLLKDIAIKNE